MKACLETFEQKKSLNSDKFAYAEGAYQRHAALIVEKFKDEIPLGQKKLNSMSRLTGKQIWETAWSSTNEKMQNIIPWLKVGPYTKDGLCELQPIHLSTPLFHQNKFPFPVLAASQVFATPMEYPQHLQHFSVFVRNPSLEPFALAVRRWGKAL